MTISVDDAMRDVKVYMHTRDTDAACTRVAYPCSQCNEGCDEAFHLHARAPSVLSGSTVTYGFCSEGCAIAFFVKQHRWSTAPVPDERALMAVTA